MSAAQALFDIGRIESGVAARPAPRPAAVSVLRHDRLLEASDLRVRFGGVAALAGASFAVAEGEICGLIGPNGAGKTTLFNCISGLTAIDDGRLSFAGERIDGAPAHAIVRKGISRTFQNLGLYPEMSVIENVLLGGYSTGKGGFVAAALRWPRLRRDERRMRDLALAALRDVGLVHLAEQQTGSLPYGTMKRIELARALMSRPRLLLLDEPAGGLAHGEVEEFAALIRDLRRRYRLTILLIEHHMRFVMELCDHVVVLHLGATLADGRPEQVKRDPHVIAAYLGAAA
jgi:branched-chain amino acid transport system ATP-binding protein